MIICITKTYPIRDSRGNDTRRKELLVDYAIDMDTGLNVIVPSVHPKELGAKLCPVMGEWVIE